MRYIKTKKTIFTVIAVFLLLALGLLAKNAGLIINITPSMPRGIYIKNYHSNITRKTLALICLHEPYQSLGLQRGYLMHGQSCHGNNASSDAAPLLKSVLALPGDDVILQNDYIAVNGARYSYRTAQHDSAGRALASYPRGSYPHTIGYWLIGTHAANSWDSRYWGPITPTQVIAQLKPLWLWE